MHSRWTLDERQSVRRYTSKTRTTVVGVSALKRICRCGCILYFCQQGLASRSQAKLTDVIMDPTILWEVNPTRKRLVVTSSATAAPRSASTATVDLYIFIYFDRFCQGLPSCQGVSCEEVAQDRVWLFRMGIEVHATLYCSCGRGRHPYLPLHETATRLLGKLGVPCRT